MNAETALWVSTLLLSLAVIQQAGECLLGHRHLEAVYAWSEVRADVAHWPAPARLLLDALHHHPRLLPISLVVGAALQPFVGSGLLQVALLVGAVAMSLRFRGTLGGGSDSMTVHALLATSGALSIGNEVAARVALAYLAVHGVLSYLLAGLCKLLNPRWRCGAAMTSFLRQFGRSPRSRCMTGPLALVGSWAVIALECGFAAAFVSRPLAILAMLAGAAFHLANARLLGLHRFVLPWLATYPALLFISP